MSISFGSPAGQIFTLIDLLQYRAATAPQQTAYIFAAGEESKELRITYAELDQAARDIAGRLQNEGAQGERVLLLYPPGLEYIKGFFGCLYAGAVAVPAYPPRNNRNMARIQSIMSDAQASYVLCNLEAAALLTRSALNGIHGHSVVVTDPGDTAASGAWRSPGIGPEHLSFLQYTSGSTGAPKGVMLTHRNILRNLEIIAEGFGLSPVDKGVIWLPPYHDMGLIGGILAPLYSGFTCVLMSPTAFLQRPQRWLEAISRYRATVSGGPDFAYQLCARNTDPGEPSNLDLSSWRVAFTGAEPIRTLTMDRFAEAFRGCGFRPESFYPCYGLAEATLMVSGGPAHALPVTISVERASLERNHLVEVSAVSQDAYQLVGCGPALGHNKIVIVDPNTGSKRNADNVGEVWVAGPSVALGYWGKQDETEHVFNAFVTDTGEGPYLRTGDLGFVRSGELFITGRLKDVMIVRGRNLYPQDLEWTVGQSDKSLRAGFGAAFTIEENDEQRIVIVQEVHRNFRDDGQRLCAAIRQVIATEHGIQVQAVVLIKMATIPKTSSGKIQRHACRRAFLNGDLHIVAASVLGHNQACSANGALSLTAADSPIAPDARQESIEQNLRMCVARVIGIAPAEITLHEPITSFGLDSVGAAELTAQVQSRFRVPVSIASLLDGITVGELAIHIEASLQGPDRSVEPFIARETDTARPLSPSQQTMWVLDQLGPTKAGYHIPVLLRLQGPVDLPVLGRAVAELVKRHDGLRTVFPTMGGLPVQVVTPADDIAVPAIHVVDLAAAGGCTNVNEMVMKDACRPFSLAEGPLFRTSLFRIDHNQYLFQIVMHHIVCDGWSLTIVIKELQALYQAFSAGLESPLLPLAVSYADYSVWTRRRLQSDVLRSHVNYWQQILRDAPRRIELPADEVMETPLNQGERMHTILSDDLVQSLHQFGRRHGVTPFMVILTALNMTLQAWTQQRDMVVGTVMANRTQPETQPLVGCFVNFLPLRLNGAASQGLKVEDLLARVKAIVLEAHAHQDAPFEAIVEALSSVRGAGESPLYNVALVMQNFGIEHKFTLGTDVEATFEGLVATNTALLDLRLIVGERPVLEGLSLECEYKSELFTSHTIQLVLESLRQAIEWIIRTPDASVSQFPLLPDLERQARAKRPNQYVLAVTSTFTSEPIEDTLKYWAEELHLPMQVAFAPYNQLFQQMFDPASLLRQNRNGVNVMLIRFEDWLKRAEDADPECYAERNVNDLVESLTATAAHSSVPFIVCVCPASPAATREFMELFTGMEERLKGGLGGLPGVHVILESDLASLYQVHDYFDPYGDHLGHIPYTPLLFAALGTLIARKVYAITKPSRKVIVLDCDNTLWNGVCAEDGPLGVEIDQAHLALQRFMVEQHNAGMLLCLCSKNHENDVFSVFEQRPDMPLKASHLVGWRIDWNSKPENLRALARELQLGLDSFIFVDDNPLECAEMLAHCPEVLTLQIPTDPGQIVRFLEHVWEFDHAGLTAEDRNRTLMYRQNAERERLRGDSTQLADFLQKLDLGVSIDEAQETQMPRIAQLTQRTNQFNLTTIRRSENEVRHLCEQPGYRCLAVEVSDRFGDYGLVGVVIYRVLDQLLDIDTFLLSCRALGRGVEHQMLAKVGELALRLGLPLVRVNHVPTKKNQPAARFLDSLGLQPTEATGFGVYYQIPAGLAAEVQYLHRTVSAADEIERPEGNASESHAYSGSQRLTALRAIARIANEFTEPASILDAIQARRLKWSSPKRRNPFAPPRTPTEAQVARIWAEVLGVEQIGVYDSFFDVGGHSLLAVQIIARVHQDFNVELPLMTLFTDSFTVSSLAQLITEQQIQLAEPEDLASVLDRLEGMSDEEVKALLASMEKER